MADSINLLDFDEHGLSRYMEEAGEKAYRARQIIGWVHQRGVTDFHAMSDLSLALRRRLAERFTLRFPEIVAHRKSRDGSEKWLLRLRGGNCIETVLIPENGRNTLCVSSQVGCALNCSFCATGHQGFNRNLTAGEIIAQLWAAVHGAAESAERRRVTNVVLMGMGEPLLNFDAVSAAVNLMQSDHAYGLSKYRVTLSTSGVVPALYRWAEHGNCALAISLHAPDNALRDVLVPINKKYPIETLMAACRHYFRREPKRKVTIEYVMLAGVNDAPAQAEQLLRVLSDLPCKVNLIPFNTFPGTSYRCSDAETIRRFASRLQRAGIVTTVRKTRGDDIAAACGQLAGEFVDRTRRTAIRLKLETGN